jgi:hypothetical protein
VNRPGGEGCVLGVLLAAIVWAVFIVVMIAILR